MRKLAISTSLLCMLVFALPGPLLANEPASSANRNVSVLYEISENSGVGTLIARLLDHHLTLRNFRSAEPQHNQIFTVDPHDGAIWVNCDGQMDFELHRRLRFVVQADEDLAEQDHFLQAFSAGLLEDGLTVGEVESLSTGTVTFDITIQLRDVPEAPGLLDTNLMVQVLDDAETEFGTIAVSGTEFPENLAFFIASGNEDDVFQINPATGTLSLRGRHARHFDTISSYELVILVENASGLSSTANVVVSVFNEIPLLNPSLESPASLVASEAKVPWISDSESRAGTLLTLPFRRKMQPEIQVESGTNVIVVENEEGDSEAEEIIVEESVELTVVGDLDSDTAAAEPTASILHIDKIDVGEAENWIVASDAAVAHASKSSADTRSKIAVPAAIDQPVTPGILMSILALIIFVISCIFASVALARASAARKAVLEEAHATDSEILAANALLLGNMQSGQEAEIVPPELRGTASDAESNLHALAGASAECKDPLSGLNSETPLEDEDDSDHIQTISDEGLEFRQISKLQEQLASRDEMIAELTRELRVVSRAAHKPASSVDDMNPGMGSDSREDCESSLPDKSQLPQCVALHPQNSGNNESQSDVQINLVTTQKKIVREFSSDRQVPVAWNSDVVFETDRSFEHSAAAVATLDDTDDLRDELADLFEMQSELKMKPNARSHETVADPVTSEAEKAEQGKEDSHLDSVKRYLSQLLERSKDPSSPDEIFADRRKGSDQHRGDDRRSNPAPARKPVKSFLDAYMSEHGGELSSTSESKSDTAAEDQSEKNAQPAKPRPPVDVKSIQASMISFRAVAMQSLENAVLSHDRRLAKGKVAMRTKLIFGLVAGTLFVFLANMVKAIQFDLLSWLMVATVVLALIELCLRIHSIRKQRRDLVSATLKPVTGPAKRTLHTSGHDDDTEE